MKITSEDLDKLPQRTHIVYRSTVDNIKSYLFIRTTEEKKVEIIEPKQWLDHDLDGSNAGGNGHHGHCRNCKMPLVTDLGYCSWDDTVCQVKGETITTVDVTHEYGWTKFENRATLLTPEDAYKHRMVKQIEQGWGTYNFQDVIKE